MQNTFSSFNFFGRAGRVFVTIVTKTAAHSGDVQLQLDPDKEG